MIIDEWTPSQFFSVPEPISLDDCLELTGGHLAKLNHAIELGTPFLNAIAALENARANAVCYFDNIRYKDNLKTVSAGLVLLKSKDIASLIPDNVNVIVHQNPYEAYAKIALRLYPEAARPANTLGDMTGAVNGIASTAILEKNVTIETGAHIGEYAQIGSGTVVASGAVIGRHVTIGRNCTIGAGAVITHTHMGDGVIIHPNTTIGKDGFGFAITASGPVKVPQVGRVIIQDNVEIGSSTTIDRGSVRDTMIGEGSRIDNQVQIAHNVVIGRFCVIAACSGLAGSTTLEDYVVMGGKTASSGHITIGKGARIAAGTDLMNDVPAGGVWAGGKPGRPINEWRREVVTLKRLAKKK